MTERSIFFKIYAGLLLVCLLTIAFSYWFVNAVNDVRVQSYRERVIASTFFLIGEELQRQPMSNKQLWLDDVSDLVGASFDLVDNQTVVFKVKELKRLQRNDVIVRQNTAGNHFSIYYKIPNSNQLLQIKLNQISDKQVRAMMAFLLADLSHYPTLGSKKARLDELSKRLGYSIALKPTKSLNLDSGQFAQVATGNIVLVFYDGIGNQNSTLSVVAPIAVQDTVLVVGPIPLFNWFPSNLLFSTALIAMLLISLGAYALIYPLEKRLKLIQIGVDEVTKGKLDTKVAVVGHDDIAKLSATFNTMTSHIKRLIDSQRELTRAVSHELRTPVARIRFAVEMLADTDDANEREQQLQEIDADIEALNDLIDEMLTYAKLEEGSPKLQWQMIGLRELTEQVVKETKALGKAIVIECNLPSKKISVMADRRYLHRVLQNFAGNALRYAKSKIIISAWVDKGVAFVSVEDDGQGIPKADRDKVFIPFARLDDSRTQASGGYGLGLSIVSRIAFWFHGTAKVDESPTLGGAKFVMSWPVKQVGETILADETVQIANAKMIIGDDNHTL